MKPLRVGLVGCGSVALSQHLPSLRRLKGDVTVAAVCDLDLPRSQEVARRFSIPHVYQDAGRMLAEQGLDLVDICTPPQTHPPLAIAAAQAGYHVLVEKPLALSLAEADAIINAAEDNGVKLCVVHNSLFNPAVTQARAMAQRGELGDIVGLQMRCLFDAETEGFLNPEHWVQRIPGGMLGEVCSHQVYVALDFLGPAQVLQAKGRRRRDLPWLGPDEVIILLETPSAWGTILVSGNSPRFEFSFEVHGTKQSLHLDMSAAQLVLLPPRRYRPFDIARDSLGRSLQLVTHTVGSGLGVAFGQLRNGHRRLIEAFIQAILEDAPPPVPGGEARQSVALLENVFGASSVADFPGRHLS